MFWLYLCFGEFLFRDHSTLLDYLGRSLNFMKAFSQQPYITVTLCSRLGDTAQSQLNAGQILLKMG